MTRKFSKKVGIQDLLDHMKEMSDDTNGQWKLTRISNGDEEIIVKHTRTPLRERMPSIIGKSIV